jgi:hypothetical protein
MIYVKHPNEIPVGTLVKYTSASRTKMVNGERIITPWNDCFGIVIKQTPEFIHVKNIRTAKVTGIHGETFKVWQVRRFK